jgi:anthranilate synthase component 2
MKKVVLIDNYDSFVYNLYQYLGEMEADVIVHRNDAISISDLREEDPTHIVLSPGPGHPRIKRDFGICGSIVNAFMNDLPILGVCLGCQGIAYALGASIVPAPTIVHGKTDRIRHSEKGIFSGVPQQIPVMRYHSLVIDSDTLPAALEVSATTADGLIMGIAHCTLPLFGLQFHPESIGTPDGKQILRNFLASE